MDKILERAIDKLEAKAEKDEKLLWEVYHKLKDSRQGDDNDLYMAREEILKMLKDNGYELPF